jgi:hypothetical protein
VTVECMKDGSDGEVIVSRLATVEVGTDDEADAITSCVIEAADDEPISKQQRPLSPAQGRALQLLAEAIERAGEVPPASNHIPPATRCVSEGMWRQYCYSGSISTGEPGSKQKAFKRAAEALVAASRVGKWEPWVWLA